MDYHVFVVSRIREARLAGRTTRDAVVHGVVTHDETAPTPPPATAPPGTLPAPKLDDRPGYAKV